MSPLPCPVCSADDSAESLDNYGDQYAETASYRCGECNTIWTEIRRTVAVTYQIAKSAWEVGPYPPDVSDEARAAWGPVVFPPAPVEGTTIRDVSVALDGLEEAMDGLVDYGPGDLTCGEAEQAAAAVAPAQATLRKIAAALDDACGILEDLYDHACPYPGAEDIVSRIEALLEGGAA